MAEIRLGDHKKVETLKVTIGADEDAKSYNVPMIGSLSVDEVSKLNDQEHIIAFFQKHIPKKVLGTLTVDEMNYLIDTWKKESQKNGSFTLGES